MRTTPRTTPRTTSTRIVSATLAVFVLTACDNIGPRDSDPAACPQAGEAASYGCARLRAVLTTSTGTPASGIVLTSIVLDSTVAGAPSGSNSALSDAQGRTGLEWTWYVVPPIRDTIGVRVVALRPGSVGAPPQRLDSVDVSVVFAHAGQRPPVDTLRWRLP